MKQVLHFQSRVLSRSVVLLSALLLASSCAKRIAFTNSSIVPAAEGQVKVSEDENDNYVVDVSVNNLAKPEKLSPPKQTYVVWLETEANGVLNMGRIDSSTGLFSNALKGSLRTTVPYKPTRVFITAEEDATIEHPGMTVVLRT